MKKPFWFISLLFAVFSLEAQPVTTKPLKKTITLVMPRTVDDDMPGTRGASVVWHPLQKKYYAAMAGNAGYPMGVYDATGKILSPETLNTGADTRGLWYNPQQKQLQGNCYSDYGWFGYTLDPKGLPGEALMIREGKYQPDDQSVGTYSINRQLVQFLYDGYVYFYASRNGALIDSMQIHWGRTKADAAADEEEGTPEDYNSTTVVYTGIKGAELGFLNITEMQVELYNIATGYLARKLKLPEEAAMNATFNFAYTNGMYWLFNIEERTWTGYK